LINDLYSYDWDSFWYSTQSKNNAFIAFHKYLTKTGVDNVANFSYSVNASSQKQGTLGGKNPNILKVEVPLNEILSATDVTGEEVKLTVKNT
jgi:hypothetical protein